MQRAIRIAWVLAAAGSRVQHRLQIRCTSPERGIEHALGQWAPDLLLMGLVGALTFVAGGLFFRRMKRGFADVL